MMLCDAGPLLSLIDKKQPKHEPCRKIIRKLAKPLTTTWACFSEAMYLAYRQGGWIMQKQLGKLLLEGLLTIYEIRQEDYSRLFELIEKYKDCPMDLADATLVLASERLGVSDILTLDSDFYVYLIHDSKPFNVLQLD
jgi:predicted nucleic acid-binding protein